MTDFALKTRFIPACLATAAATAVLAGCTGLGGDGARADAPRAARAPATATGSPEPSSSGAASPSASISSPSPVASPVATGHPVLPASASGRTPVLGHGPRGEEESDKVVALTFDAVMAENDEKSGSGEDGGERAAEAGDGRFDNPGLFDALREEKVPATVFATGVWARNHPEQAEALGSDPLFEVAGHSHSYRAFTTDCRGLPVLDPGSREADVRRGFDALREAGVADPVPYFRFPGGCYDEQALRAIAPTGVTAVHWDVEAGDAGASDAEAVAERVLSSVRPGSVVALDSMRGTAPATEEAVRLLVPELRERGYRFVRVSELIASVTGAAADAD